MAHGVKGSSPLLVCWLLYAGGQIANHRYEGTKLSTSWAAERQGPVGVSVLSFQVDSQARGPDVSAADMLRSSSDSRLSLGFLNQTALAPFLEESEINRIMSPGFRSQSALGSFLFRVR